MKSEKKEKSDTCEQNESCGACDESNMETQCGKCGKKNGIRKCRCHAYKKRSPEELNHLVHRLNRIEGQIRGIRGMLENDAYCPDILTQASAVSAAVNAFNRELLAAHIRSCVVQDIRDGKDEIIDELVVVLQRLMK